MVKRKNTLVLKKGLRQGDPISPYIFVLCMDKLFHMIMDAFEYRRWDTMRPGRKGPLISHLMFSNDLLLFGRATCKQMMHK